jgi:DNA polymerase-3 subunit delta'
VRKEVAALKRLFPALIGNEAMREQIGSRVLGDTLAHAYVIQGERGTGKRLFAHQLAAALSCERRGESGGTLPCGECSFCRKLLEIGTPDLKTLSRGDAATIGIDAVRRMREDMYLSPTECEKKVYIIEDADTMTAAAQNALLIVLEEPPPDVLILLLCRDASLLLPTVRSRVQTLRMERFTREALDAYLSRDLVAARLRDTDPALYGAILSAASGAPGEAKRLLEKGEQNALIESRQTALEFLHALRGRAGFGDLLAVTGKLPTKRGECMEQLQLVMLAVRDMILYKRDASVEPVFFSSPEALEEESDAFSIRRLFLVWDILSEAIDALSENANLHVTLTTMSDALLSRRA